DEPDRAGLAGLVQSFGLLAGHHQHADAGPAAAKEPRGLDPADLGHADVHDHDVRLLPARELEGLLAVRRQSHHLEPAVCLERGGHRLEETWIVVRDDYPRACLCLAHRSLPRFRTPYGVLPNSGRFSFYWPLPRRSRGILTGSADTRGTSRWQTQ